MLGVAGAAAARRPAKECGRQPLLDVHRPVRRRPRPRIGALSVASQAPAELQGSFADAASSAFVQGMSRGSLVAAGVAFVGAVAAALFLPGRLTPEDVIELDGMGSFPGLGDLAPEPA